jgi:hypothetical protein
MATWRATAESAAIEFFSGPHTINGQGTFEFFRHISAGPRGRAEALGQSKPK